MEKSILNFHFSLLPFGEPRIRSLIITHEFLKIYQTILIDYQAAQFLVNLKNLLTEQSKINRSLQSKRNEMHCGNQTLLKNNSSISTTPTITPRRMLPLESIPSWCTKVFAFLQSQMLLGARFLSFPLLLLANCGSRDKDSKNRIAVKAKLMISMDNGQNRTSSSRMMQIS